MLRSPLRIARVRKIKGAIAPANPRQYTKTAVESNGLPFPRSKASSKKKMAQKTYVSNRKGFTPYDSVSFRNSRIVSSATMPATTANTETGARRISTSTIGISTTAVAIRLIKKMFGLKDGGAIITSAARESVFP